MKFKGYTIIEKKDGTFDISLRSEELFTKDDYDRWFKNPIFGDFQLVSSDIPEKYKEMGIKDIRPKLSKKFNEVWVCFGGASWDYIGIEFI